MESTYFHRGVGTAKLSGIAAPISTTPTNDTLITCLLTGAGCWEAQGLPTPGASLGVSDVGPDWAPNIRHNGVHA